MARAAVLILSLFAGPGLAAVDPGDIRLPEGFSIEVYAEVPGARSLALGRDGIVYVSTRRGDEIYAILPGRAGNNAVFEIDDGLDTPNGIAWHDGDLYVAEISRVSVYRDIDGRLGNPPRPERLDIDLPSESAHGWRYIGIGPEGRLHIAIGAPCNVCDRSGFARIDRMDLDGSNRETVAFGVRNSVGLTWHPETGDLWFTDNGRDMLGDDLPPDELNRVSAPGQHFGFPYCHGGFLQDREFGADKRCADYVPPVQRLGPHVAALGLRFYTGEMFPAEYRGQLLIAEHGSWNRSKKIGYRIMLVRLDGNEAVSYEPFAEGWHDGQQTKGRPVDLLVMPDGALLVSDDYNGVVYRITYEESR